MGVGTVSFAAADFYKALDAGFPSNISGIGNGEVNGVKFQSAVVAGARVSLDGLADAETDSDIGDVVVKTPVNARVDIFGLGSSVPTVAKAKKAGGATLVQDEPVLRIVSNTPNSGALGVTPGGPSPSVPEPSAALVFGAGLVVVASRLRSTSKR